jgi:hypothetical protein
MYTMCVCIYICKIYHNMWNNLFVIKINIHISISTLKPLLPKAWSWVHITVVCKVHGDGGFFNFLIFLIFSIVNFVSRRRRRWPNPIDQVRTRLRLWSFLGFSIGDTLEIPHALGPLGILKQEVQIVSGRVRACPTIGYYNPYKEKVGCRSVHTPPPPPTHPPPPISRMDFCIGRWLCHISLFFFRPCMSWKGQTKQQYRRRRRRRVGLERSVSLKGLCFNKIP